MKQVANAVQARKMAEARKQRLAKQAAENLKLARAAKADPWSAENRAKLKAAQADGRHDPTVLRNVALRLQRIIRQRAEERITGVACA